MDKGRRPCEELLERLTCKPCTEVIIRKVKDLCSEMNRIGEYSLYLPMGYPHEDGNMESKTY
jgi:hypothetical protein